MADIAAAWRRLERALLRRPNAGLQIDAAATARWHGGTRVLCTHVNGAHVLTDMPESMGGDGTGVTPGWLLRAGLASCTATMIAMLAALEGIQLEVLEVVASSRSDVRGMIGIADANGNPVEAAPRDMELRVRVSATGGIAPNALRDLVERANRCSAVSRALQASAPIELLIECAVS